MSRYEILSVSYNKESDLIKVRVLDKEEDKIFLAEIYSADVMDSRLLTEVTP